RLSPYQSMVELLVGHQELEAALAYAERSKARTLLDVLNNGRINVTKAMTAGQRSEERALDARLVSLNTQIAREASRADRNPERLAALKSELQKSRLERESFQDKLYAEHPELKVNRGRPEPLKIEDVSQLLPDANGALLEYLVTD